MQACHIIATDLACRRGDRQLFSGVTMDLRGGQAVQVVGQNGIGKSSLIRIIAGLLRPAAGKVSREGAIGLVNEQSALDPALPLGLALAFWRRIDGAGDDAIARLGLADLLDVPVRYLSTGQVKRAVMARLMGQGAAVWLLDEPLNGLDAEASVLVQTLTAEHCAEGGIAVIASHQGFVLDGMAQLDLATFSPSSSAEGLI